MKGIEAKERTFIASQSERSMLEPLSKSLDGFLTDDIMDTIGQFSHRRYNGHYWTVFSLYFITDEIWRWYFHYILSRTIFGSAKSRQKFQTIFAIYIAIKLTDITARPICSGWGANRSEHEI